MQKKTQILPKQKKTNRKEKRTCVEFFGEFFWVPSQPAWFPWSRCLFTSSQNLGAFKMWVCGGLDCKGRGRGDIGAHSMAWSILTLQTPTSSTIVQSISRSSFVKLETLLTFESQLLLDPIKLHLWKRWKGSFWVQAAPKNKKYLENDVKSKNISNVKQKSNKMSGYLNASPT